MPWAYCSLDVLKDKLADTGTGDDAHYRSALESASRVIDDYMQRRFQPYSATRYMTAEYPYWLAVPDLLSVTTLKTYKTDDRASLDTWSTSDYDLWPFDATIDERPYREIRTRPTGTYSFPTFAHGVEIVGTWGFWQDTVAATTLGAAIDSTTATTFTATSGATLDVLQTIIVDSEQMYITGISSNTVTVQRGVNGTTAATHDNAAAVSYYRYHPSVVEACTIQASRLFRRKDAPFGVTGSPEFGQVAVVARLDPDVRSLLTWVGRRLTAGAA